MRWTTESWRAYVDHPVPHVAGPVGPDVPWCDAPASVLAARVDLAYRAAHALAGWSPPTVIANLDGTVTCCWTSPMVAPAPFRQGCPQTWVFPPASDLTALAPLARQASPELGLVTTVGVTNRHDVVLVDLAHWGALGVDAPAARASDVVRAIAAGFGAPPLAPPPALWWGGIDPASGWSADQGGDVVDDAETAVDAVAATATLPAVAVIDRWFACAASPFPARRAVVAVGRSTQGLWLQERHGRWHLEPHHLEVMPVGAVHVDLPDLSGDPQQKEHHMTTSTPAALSVHRLTSGLPTASRAPLPHERPWPLMVSVLGTPRVVDQHQQPVEFERSKALELVVWLALHRPRCTRSGARGALWDLPIRDGSFANIVCEARRRLGASVMAPSGSEWIGRGLGDELPLHPHVVTDAEQLRLAVRSAHGNADPACVQRLGDMLQLVRGVPFEGTAYLWADAEGLTSELTMVIVQASAALGRRHLEAGDVSGVFEATAVGLRVVPRHEELIALRLRAHHRNGDDAGVRQEWSSYERALALDAFSSRPSSKLLALRQELLRRPVSA